MEGRSSQEYFAQLLKDKKQIEAFPNVFSHLERLLDEEIYKVRGNLFQFPTNKEPLSIPEATGQFVTSSKKLYVPANEHPDFNFVGRILGPRGKTVKLLEQETGCKIRVRGKGSLRDKQKEEIMRDKPNWEHLSEELHILITVEDHRQRGEMKLQRAVNEVKKLLVPLKEDKDDLKKCQFMELQILNGTCRDIKSSGGTYQSASPGSLAIPAVQTSPAAASELPRMAAGAGAFLGVSGMFPVQYPAPQGVPSLIAQRFPQSPMQPQVSLASHMNRAVAAFAATAVGPEAGGPPPLMPPTEAGLFYPVHDPYNLTTGALLLQYPGFEQSRAGHIPPQYYIHH